MAAAGHINLFGLTQYDNKTSFFGGVPVLSQVRTARPLSPHAPPFGAPLTVALPVCPLELVASQS